MLDTIWQNPRVKAAYQNVSMGSKTTKSDKGSTKRNSSKHVNIFSSVSDFPKPFCSHKFCMRKNLFASSSKNLEMKYDYSNKLSVSNQTIKIEWISNTVSENFWAYKIPFKRFRFKWKKPINSWIKQIKCFVIGIFYWWTLSRSHRSTLRYSITELDGFSMKQFWKNTSPLSAQIDGSIDGSESSPSCKLPTQRAVD